MRKMISGFAVAAALAISAIVATPQSASALDFSITFGTSHPPIVRHHYDPRPVRPHAVPARPHYGAPSRHYGRDYRRDRRDRRAARDCVVRTERYWTGYSWVTERRRVCR
ncbi:MAG: hypothetical protein EA385_08325 [Salinarimonadaceae bacterium]|nr:MAG: hypothetical protein EA385_08325 [Salinarimonadaceae bacterium]